MENFNFEKSLSFRDCLRIDKVDRLYHATLSGRAAITLQDLYAADNIEQSGFYVGQMADGPDGKIFRYAKAGASNLVVGNLLQSPVIDTQFDDMTVAADTAIGAQSVVLTNGTTVLTGSEFKGGTFEASVTPGLGDEYTILDNSSAGSGGNLTVYLDRPLRTALTNAASKVTMRKSPWYGVIQFPATTPTGIPAGVAVYAIPASNFGWIQTHGLAAVLSDGSTFAVGSDLGTPSGTAGCATVFAAGTTHARIGYAYRAAASGKTIPVFLQID